MRGLLVVALLTWTIWNARAYMHWQKQAGEAGTVVDFIGTIITGWNVAIMAAFAPVMMVGELRRLEASAAADVAPRGKPSGVCPKREGGMAHVIPAGKTRCVLCFPAPEEPKA